MARLLKQRRATVDLNGEEVGFTLREPSNQELNEFLSSRWGTGKKGKFKDNAFEKRCDFFDRLLVKVENLEDADGNPVTPERADAIPSNWKADIVFKLFEDSEIDVKN